MTGLLTPDATGADPVFRIRWANGLYVSGDDGARLLDLTSGWNVVNAGWANVEIAKACKAAITALPFRPAWVSEEALSDLQEMFRRIAPGYTMICSCTGAEAVDNALKVARMVTGRPAVLTFEGSYHGSATGAALASSEEVSHLDSLDLERFRVSVPRPGIADDLEGLRALLDQRDDIGAVVLETVATNSGCAVLDPEIGKQICGLMAEYGVLVIGDEIGTGMNRTGSILTWPEQQCRPDLLVMGKALTNGFYPLSLCLVKNNLVAFVDSQAFASTYGGAPLGCAAALATISFHEEAKLGAAAIRNGTRLKAELHGMLDANPFIGAIQGRGLDLAIHIRWQTMRNLKPRTLLQRLRERGLFATLSGGEHALMLMPPLTIDDRAIDFALEQLSNVLRD